VLKVILSDLFTFNQFLEWEKKNHIKIFSNNLSSSELALMMFTTSADCGEVLEISNIYASEIVKYTFFFHF